MISECFISKYNDKYTLVVDDKVNNITETEAIKLINYGIPCKNLGTNYIVEVSAEPINPTKFYYDVNAISKDNAIDMALEEFKTNEAHYVYKNCVAYTYDEFKTKGAK